MMSLCCVHLYPEVFNNSIFFYMFPLYVLRSFVLDEPQATYTLLLTLVKLVKEL